jgi:hypothetical protein
VFAITNADPPVAITAPGGIFTGVGTIRSTWRSIRRSRTASTSPAPESFNEVPRGPNLRRSSVRSHLSARITVLDAPAPAAAPPQLPRLRHGAESSGVRPAATPLGMALTGDSATLYVTT